LSVSCLLEDPIIRCSWRREAWLYGSKYFHWFLEEVSTVKIYAGNKSILHIYFDVMVSIHDDCFQIT
jgi:hypothetical protein